MSKTAKAAAVFETQFFTKVLCRCPFKWSRHYDKWLALQYKGKNEWYAPGVDAEHGQDMCEGARRSTWRDTGIQVDLKGLLHVE